MDEFYFILNFHYEKLKTEDSICEDQKMSEFNVI